eukprot:TRINITY_DN330_c1_g2_i8.p1 TRINITY_DN330_c1_g2~~TRINITY_DN330_c1_g2_i8.p1  ORF type:complete len:341 (+),score=34.66 TRINITY_DN330_c1_g2_i8:536-1558(+)
MAIGTLEQAEQFLSLYEKQQQTPAQQAMASAAALQEDFFKRCVQEASERDRTHRATTTKTQNEKGKRIVEIFGAPRQELIPKVELPSGWQTWASECWAQVAAMRGEKDKAVLQPLLSSMLSCVPKDVQTELLDRHNDSHTIFEKLPHFRSQCVVGLTNLKGIVLICVMRDVHAASRFNTCFFSREYNNVQEVLLKLMYTPEEVLAGRPIPTPHYHGMPLLLNEGLAASPECEVYRCTWNPDGRDCIVKVLPASQNYFSSTTDTTAWCYTGARTGLPHQAERAPRSAYPRDCSSVRRPSDAGASTCWLQPSALLCPLRPWHTVPETCGNPSWGPHVGNCSS